jgi:hypothetical protein
VHLASVVDSVAFIVHLMIYDYEFVITEEGGWLNSLFIAAPPFGIMEGWHGTSYDGRRYDLMKYKST